MTDCEGAPKKNERDSGERSARIDAPRDGAAMTGTLTSRDAMRVMIVDDHADSLHSVGRLLRVLGYDVRAARDGPEALSCAAAFLPDAALIDLSLPGMDGCDVARRLRALEATRATRLIAMTGWATRESASRTKEAGFDMHLVKPLTMNVLTDALSRGRM
jgi:CheY-like chemotaxis protein